MKRLIVSLVLFSAIAMLKEGTFAFQWSHERSIVSNACVMSYTDSFGRSLWVIRSNPLTVYIR